MTMYRAVVKYPVDADAKTKERELRDGIGWILSELISEHDYDQSKVESLMDDAQQEGELELQTVEEIRAREKEKEDA